MPDTVCPKCGHSFWIPGDPDLMARHWPEACLVGRCTFYTHYLKHGDPDLNHAAYHAAEMQCEGAQAAALAQQDKGRELSLAQERYLARLEARIRA